MTGLRDGYAAVNGIRLHYVAAGDPAAPLMLFVHGFPEFWYAWKDQLAEFGRDHHAVAVDLRGHNLSDKPEGIAAYRVKPLLEDLRQLIAHLCQGKDDPRCTLVAHDWGGAIAWTFAAAFPQMLHRLVIINAPHSVPFARLLAGDAAQQQASGYFLLFRMEGKAERVLAENNYARLLAMFRHPQSGRSALADADVPRYIEAWSQPGALTCALSLYRASPLYPPTAGDPGAAALKLDPAALAVKVPTLVIWGEADTALLPSLLDDLPALVPDLRIVRIADGSHWVIHEQPERVNSAIRAFLLGASRPAPAV